MLQIWNWIESHIFVLVLVLIIIYVLISVLVYFLQDRFLFRPEKLPEEFQFAYENLTFDEYKLEVKDGVVLSGLHFKSTKPKGVVFYLKGNSRSIKGWGKFAIDFVRHKYDVIMVDYRGFGKSKGKRNQEEIKKDLQYIYDAIKERVAESHIILYGRSMGSGFATKLASTNNPRMLILDAPYYSMEQVAKRYLPFMPLSWLLRFPIPTYKWIKYVKCPIHIIHGTNDRLIPYKSSIKLSKINSKLSRMHSIIGGGHNNLHTFESYHEILDQILTKDKIEFDKEQSSIGFTKSRKKT